MTRLGRLSALAGAALIAFGQTAPAYAQFRGGGFSVSGKKGPFIEQAASRSGASGPGAGAAMGLASDAVNQGQFQAGRLRMPETEARIQALLNRIEGSWPYDKSLPLKVHVVGADFYNAYALPDGSVVVAFGLLEHARSDDEVAFILSHELGHVRLGHFARQEQAQSDGPASRLGQAIVVGSALSAVSGGSLDAAAVAAGRRAEAAGDLAHFINTVASGPRLSREHEDEADALGFDLTNLTSYSAETASAQVFDTIQADEERRARITEALDATVKSQLGQAVKDGSALSAIVGGGVSSGTMLRIGGRLALGMARGGDGGPKHRTPEQRKKGIADYSVDAYPQGLPARDEQTAWLDGVRSSAEYAQAKVAVAAVSQAMTARAEGKYPEAEAAIAPALASTFRDAPLVLNAAAHIRDSMGDVDGADALYRRAHKSSDQSIDGYVDHARMLYKAQRNEPALQLIDEGVARFGDDDKPFIALTIAVTRQAGRQDVSEQFHRRCLGYNDAALKKDCDLAAGTQQAKATGGPRLPGGLMRAPGLPF